MRTRAVYPGTFDPVHNGHLDLMQRAAALFDELVVGVFDHGRPSKSVLFSVDERLAMIQGALGTQPKITIRPFSGLLVEFARDIGARVIIRGLRVFSDFEFEFRMALANERLAPEIEVVNFITREEHTFLSGTIIREIASFGGDVSSMVPPNVAEALKRRFNDGNPEGYTAPVSLRD
ncbi:MAG: pantetheine-phosphate adenylyltransferase [Chloroflexi bacterium]|nr:pantetheine-phosphate adenylyltransferase [Chloroflexota bacterium]MCI0574757.1 pantetheine-phosphate adenylyltransferase [Chloroflexota bacterium]MCI0644643.1 pantetheine-phosphate adenylyltransferase [Chloroflexota bacterium]MCI0726514.1 pantetheine-phosphate adenylyltransferase [Chloroflexota bacterium]